MNINEDCRHCFEGHAEFDYDNCVLYDDKYKVWIDYVCTGEFILLDNSGYGYYETLETIVNYCKMCGRKLD